VIYALVLTGLAVLVALLIPGQWVVIILFGFACGLAMLEWEFRRARPEPALYSPEAKYAPVWPIQWTYGVAAVLIVVPTIGLWLHFRDYQLVSMSTSLASYFVFMLAFSVGAGVGVAFNALRYEEPEIVEWPSSEKSA
jgi:hypothetical protein